MPRAGRIPVENGELVLTEPERSPVITLHTE